MNSSTQDDVREAMKASEPSNEPSAAAESKAPLAETKPADVSIPPKEAAESNTPAKTAAAEGSPKVAPVPVPEAKTGPAAPSSWSPASRELWNTLPESVREEVNKREQDSHTGVSKLKAEFDSYKSFSDTINSRFGGYFQSQGVVDPASAIVQVLSTEQALRTGSPEQKFHTLLRVADDYGIPLRQMFPPGARLPAAGANPEQLHPAVKAQLDELAGWRAGVEQRAITSEIASFSADPKNEFFNDVKGMMADLIEAKVCNSLKEAYDRAIWAHEGVRGVMLGRQAGAGAAAQASQRASAAAAISPAPGNAVVVPDGDADDSIEGMVKRAYREGSRA